MKSAWKIRLIEENNPNWEDLYPGLPASMSVAVIPREGGVSSTLRR